MPRAQGRYPKHGEAAFSTSTVGCRQALCHTRRRRACRESQVGVLNKRDGNYSYANATKTISFALPVDEPIHYSVQYNGYKTSGGHKYHKYRFYVNGQLAWSVTDVDNATSFIRLLPSGTAWSEHVAYNKMRLFSSVIRSEDFTPPVAADYL